MSIQWQLLLNMNEFVSMPGVNGWSIWDGGIMSLGRRILILILALAALLAYPLYRWLQSPISETTHNPEAEIQALAKDKDAGQKVYQQFCYTCHAEKPMVEMHAPHIGNAADWAPYRKKGLDAMLKSADTGKGNMPPRGGCFECSDELLKQAIQYMLPKEKIVNDKKN